jgi:hypothetical protein
MRLKATSALELTKGRGEGDVSTIVGILLANLFHRYKAEISGGMFGIRVKTGHKKPAKD